MCMVLAFFLQIERSVFRFFFPFLNKNSPLFLSHVQRIGKTKAFRSLFPTFIYFLSPFSLPLATHSLEIPIAADCRISTCHLTLACEGGGELWSSSPFRHLYFWCRRCVRSFNQEFCSLPTDLSPLILPSKIKRNISYFSLLNTWPKYCSFPL